MQTINSNLSSMLSTAELREMERIYANPATKTEGLILRGIQAQMQENSGAGNKTEREEELEGAIKDAIELIDYDEYKAALRALTDTQS